MPSPQKYVRGEKPDGMSPQGKVEEPFQMSFYDLSPPKYADLQDAPQMSHGATRTHPMICHLKELSNYTNQHCSLLDFYLPNVFVT